MASLISVDQLRRLIRQELRALLGHGTRRGTLREYSVEGGRPYVLLEGAPGEVIEGQLVEAFGLASRPTPGMGMVALASGGQHVVIAAEDRNDRPDPGQGETILYNAYGQRVALGTSSIRLNEGLQPVARQGESCSFTLSANLSTGAVTGTIEVAGGSSEVLVP